MKYKIYGYTTTCDIAPTEDGIYYLLYKILNINTGQYYIGIHKTRNLDDGYSGSGKALQRAMSLSNKSDFIKIIIGCYQTPDEMMKAEAESVTMEQVNDPLCFNLCPGGCYTGECRRRTMKGSVFMWNPKIGERTRVYPELIKTYEDNGWVVGYGPVPNAVKSGTIAGKIYISKNGKLRTINESELQQYVAMGWNPGVDGRPHSRPLIGRKRMFNKHTNESKIVKANEWGVYIKWVGNLVWANAN